MNNSGKHIAISIIVAILVFGIGYALFSDTITVSGTAGTTGSMNIDVTSVTVTSLGAGTVSTENGDTSKNNQWNIAENKNDVILTINNLQYPGSSATYTITLTNTGTVDAKLTSIIKSNTADNLVITTTNINEEDIIAANGTKTFTVTVTWKEDSITGFTGEPFTIKYNFEQSL